MPPGTSAVYNGYYAAMISGGTQVGRRHKFRVEMRDAGGELLRKFNESRVYFETAGPGHLRGGYRVVSLHDVQFPGVGEYEFVAFVDGQRVGSSEFWVIPPPAGVL
jgi:hypothetical protein